VHGSTRKFVWRGSYQNHQYTDNRKNDHVLGKPAHTKLRLRGRCSLIVHGWLTKGKQLPVHVLSELPRFVSSRLLTSCICG
jgi:hypothetical protein